MAITIFIKQLLIILITFAAFGFTFAQEINEYVWKVKKAGSEKTLYLAGTIHVPTEWKNHPVLEELINQIKLKTFTGELSYSSDQDEFMRYLRYALFRFNERAKECANFAVKEEGDHYKINTIKIDQSLIKCVNDPSEKNSGKKKLSELIPPLLFSALLEISYFERISSDGLNNQSEVIEKEQLRQELELYSATAALRTIEQFTNANTSPAAASNTQSDFDNLIAEKLISKGSQDLIGGLDQLISIEHLTELLKELEIKEIERAKNFNKSYEQEIKDKKAQLLNLEILTKVISKDTKDMCFNFMPKDVKNKIAQEEIGCSRYYELIQYDRNNQWLSIIDYFFKTKNFEPSDNALFFGGLYHFYGTGGVLYRLLNDYNADENYEVFQLYLNAKGELEEKKVETKDVANE
jgi:hypothetical protein